VTRSQFQEPDSLRKELIQRCDKISPILRQNASYGERKRSISQANIEALDAAGLLQLATPRRYGGIEADLRTLVDVAARIGEDCGSTAWILMNFNLNSWIGGLLNIQAQEEIFGSNTHSLIAGVVAPTHQVQRI